MRRHTPARAKMVSTQREWLYFEAELGLNSVWNLNAVKEKI